MLFNSLHYIFFFIVVACSYFFIPIRFRNLFLLVCSYYFYASWNANYVFLIIVSTLIDYVCAREMERSSNQPYRKFLFLFSIIVNLSILFFFKYLNFFDENLFALSGMRVLRTPMELLIPVGISFYTFQTIIYSSDVYNKKIAAEKNIIRFALHVCFFPQLVSGPIERAKDLIPQFVEVKKFNHKAMTSGIRLMLWGYFKKIVVSNNIYPLKLYVFDNSLDAWAPTTAAPIEMFLCLYLLVFYMYCDFSGYCDIAVGSARVLGFRLRKNFKEPFLSTSFFEFIGKWHITLVSFFRVFLYQNLLRKFKIKFLTIMVVFLISGLWHGADWSFVIWGGCLGLLLIFNSVFRKLVGRHKKRGYKTPAWVNFFKGVGVFFVFAFVGIFSMSGNMPRAVHIIVSFYQRLSWQWIMREMAVLFNPARYQEIFNLSFSTFILSMLFTSVVFGVEFIHSRYGGIDRFLARRRTWIRWAIYYGVIIVILLFGKFELIEYEYYRI